MSSTLKFGRRRYFCSKCKKRFSSRIMVAKEKKIKRRLRVAERKMEARIYGALLMQISLHIVSRSSNRIVLQKTNSIFSYVMKKFAHTIRSKYFLFFLDSISSSSDVIEKLKKELNWRGNSESVPSGFLFGNNTSILYTYRVWKVNCFRLSEQVYTGCFMSIKKPCKGLLV